MSTTTYIIIMAVCLLLSAYFSATETAFSSANITRLKTRAEKGNSRAALACKLLERYDKLLSTILIGNNIVNIAMASLGTVLFVRSFGDMGATLSTVVVTVVVLIFGEISPKSIAKDEGDLLKNAIGFSEQEAQDILIHRVDLAALPVTASKDEVADLFTQTKYSRLLIYREDIDHIIGTIHQKDFYVGCGVTDKPLEEILSPALFVLENEPISLLLKKLQSAKTQVAVVVDEYGGTCGIVTMEDILEELVGEIWDEHDEEEVFIRKIGEDTYLVDASMDFDDFAEFFHLTGETDMTSVSGWVMEQCDRVPEVGDHFTCQGLRVQVTRVDNHRTGEIRVTVEQKPEEPVQEN